MVQVTLNNQLLNLRDSILHNGFPSKWIPFNQCKGNGRITPTMIGSHFIIFNSLPIRVTSLAAINVTNGSSFGRESVLIGETQALANICRTDHSPSEERMHK